MNRKRRPKLSAVIACYGDEPAIPVMVERLQAVFARLDVEGEILYVNDCSPDNAAAVLDDLAERDPSVIVVHHTRNFGSQAAFTSGMRRASGDAVVLLDGDLQDPPELIEDFYREWRRGAEVVYGVRVRRVTSFGMAVAYKLFYRLFRRLAYVPIPLDAGDFSLLDRRVVDALNDLPEQDRFLRGLRAWAGFRQVGVPYVRPARPFGHSTNNLLRNLGWARQAICSFSYAPLDALAPLGLVILGLGGVVLLLQLLLPLLFSGMTVSGLALLAALVLFLGGVQILSVGVLGSYLAQIHREVKGRPAYLVDRVCNSTGRRKKPAPGARTG